jgi:hypothetical protein
MTNPPELTIFCWRNIIGELMINGNVANCHSSAQRLLSGQKVGAKKASAG